MISWLADPQAWLALGTLTALEIVLGIDNIIFISILASKLPQAEQARARFWGLNEFIGRHPTIKMLALSFLLLVGVMLIGEGLHFHIPKGYIYFAMAFSVFVEMLNTKARRRRMPPVKLRQRYAD